MYLRLFRSSKHDDCRALSADADRHASRYLTSSLEGGRSTVVTKDNITWAGQASLSRSSTYSSSQLTRLYRLSEISLKLTVASRATSTSQQSTATPAQTPAPSPSLHLALLSSSLTAAHQRSPSVRPRRHSPRLLTLSATTLLPTTRRLSPSLRAGQERPDRVLLALVRTTRSVLPEARWRG